ncbi:MAG: AbrB/MazE/SpoVT family DNA-binding domain-containing protein [Thermomicrobiales bacterium]
MISKTIDSTMTSGGRVTIPAAIRERLGITAGDKLLFVIGEDGRIELRAAAYSTIASLRGAAGSLEKPYSWHEMRAIAREDRANAHHRD